jgi:hypothetical protein
VPGGDCVRAGVLRRQKAPPAVRLAGWCGGDGC